MKIEHTSSLLAILDDDKSVQSALRDLIESEGMSALCFDSAEQFLDSGARHKAACLIADNRMPGMSGIELQANLKIRTMPHTDHLHHRAWRHSISSKRDEGRCE